MIKCLILDLDGTLIDTSPLDGLRENGRWHDIDAALHLCRPYEAVVDVLNTSRALGLKVAVFTNSPSNYAQKVLKYFDIAIDYLVAYHDVRKHKPHGDGVQRILDRFQLTANEVVYLGNAEEDFAAATAAKVEYFSVDWAGHGLVPKKHFGVSRLLEFIGVNTHDPHEVGIRSPIVQNASHFFLGYYLLGVKQEIWAFKDAKKSAINRWLSKTHELSGSLPHVDYVVRALGHTETHCTPGDLQKPLDHLSKHVATCLNAVYQPDILLKSCPY